MRLTHITLAVLSSIVLVWAVKPFESVWKFDSSNIEHEEGYSYTWVMPELILAPIAVVLSDSIEDPQGSDLQLLEDGLPLRSAHSLHETIRRVGSGHYSHWGDRVVFASSDNSDPRTNGRVYEARASVKPAHQLIVLACGTFGGICILGTLRLIRRMTPMQMIWLARGTVVIVTLSLGLASITAILSRWNLFTVERTIRGDELAPFDSALPLLAWPFDRFVAPFLEAGSCSPMQLRHGNEVIRQITSHCEVPAWGDPHWILDLSSWLSDGQFWDAGSYINMRLGVKPLPSDDFVLHYPVHASSSLIIILWGSLVVVIALGAVMFGSKETPSVRTTIRWFIRGSASLGAVLLIVNTAGVFTSLRSLELQPLSSEIARISSGPGDLTMSLEEARKSIRRRAGEAVEEFADRLTQVVSDATAHSWSERVRTRFNLRVPFWENYILWLAGEISPRYRTYTFADPRKALERGVGLCSQVSLILVSLLREEGIDARIVQLDGHTLVTAQVAAGKWHMLDADYGVVIPHSLAEIEKDPEMIRPYYSAALTRLNPEAQRIRPESNRELVDSLVNYFSPAGNFIEPAGAHSVLGSGAVEFEVWAYWLKWRLPLVLFLPILTTVAIVYGKRWVAAPGANNNARLVGERTLL
jgi:Transglutaminase-like superfamily